MAMYVPTRTRRLRALAGAGAALVIGVLLGFAGGRATAPSAQDQIRSVQEDARETAAGLRVISLHSQAGAEASGADGAALVLERTESELRRALHAAPWISTNEGDELLAGLDALAEVEDRSSSRFGADAEELATQIDGAFGTAPS